MEDLVSILMHSRNQVHVFHLRVNGEGSYAMHKALEIYYEEIVDLVDTLVESYQGKYGLINFKSVNKIDNDATLENVISYFERLCGIVNRKYDELNDSYLHNILDEISTLLYQTKYRLKNLQ